MASIAQNTQKHLIIILLLNNFSNSLLVISKKNKFNMNFIVIVILLLVNVHLSKSFTSYGSFRKLTCLRASSVDSYITEATDLLSSDAKAAEIMKVALCLLMKEKEKEKELMVMKKEKDINENYYLKKLSILSQRYDHIIIIIE